MYIHVWLCVCGCDHVFPSESFVKHLIQATHIRHLIVSLSQALHSRYTPRCLAEYKSHSGRKSKDFLRVWNANQHSCAPAASFTYWLFSSVASDGSTFWLMQNTAFRLQRSSLEIKPNQIGLHFSTLLNLSILYFEVHTKAWKPSVQETEGEHRKHPWWLKTKEDLQN